MRHVFCFYILLFASPALATGVYSGLTYQGRVIKPDSLPLEAASVVFRLQVRSPDANNCVLYEESHTVDMRSTGGVFSLTLGNGTRGGADPGLNFKDVFSNAMNFAGPLICGAGSSYSPASGHVRKLRVTFNDGGGEVALTPDMNIQSVPYAFYAEKLQGKGASDLLQVNTSGANSLTQANLQAAFTNTNQPKLMDLINGVSSQYLRSSPTSSVSFNSQRLTNLADPTAAQDAATKNYCDINMGGNTLDDSDIASGVGDGKVLTWDAAGNKWVAEDPVTGMDNLGNHIATQDLDMDGSKIVTVADPTAAQDAATKNYVDTKLITKTLPSAPTNAEDGMALKYDDGTGAWVYYTPISAGADNLGDHTATQNIELGPNYLSGDGDNEGIFVDSTGQIGIGTNTPGSPIEVRTGTPGSDTYTMVSKDSTFNRKVGFFWKTGGAEGGIKADSQLHLNPAGLLYLNPANGSGAGTTFSNGLLGVGTTNASGTPGSKLAVFGGATVGSAYFNTAAPANGLLVQGSAGVGTSTPDGSAVLDVASTTKGVLLPRMTTVERNAITSPATGLQVYNTSDNKLQFYNGSAWVDVGSNTASGASQVTNTPAGNIAATTAQAAIDELDSEKVAKAGDTMTGTLNLPANGLVAGTNQLALSGGNVGIGTATPDSTTLLHMYAPSGAPRLRIQNGSSGKSSLELMNTAANWIVSNESTNGNFHIDSAAAGGTEFAIQYSSGNVGIGTASPSGKLDVEGGDVFIGAGTLTNASASEDLSVTGNLEVDGVIYGDGSGLTNLPGGPGETIEAKSADFTIGSGDTNKFFLVSGNTTATLPDPSAVGANFSMTIKRTGTDNVTVVPNGAETIDGAESISLAQQFSTARFITDGFNWFLAFTYKTVSIGSNFFGDGSDGAGVFSSNTNFSATQDGDMVVKQFSSLTIDAGVTVTLNNRAKGMIVYVSGDATINGVLSMTARGANVDPVAAGVSATGLRIPMLKTGATDTLSAADFAGTGGAAVTTLANQPGISGNGKIYTIARGGASGAAGSSGTGNGAGGTNGSAGLSGGGGAGATGFPGANSITAAAGTAGTAFSGGTGGGGSRDNLIPATVAQANGGAGGDASGSGNWCNGGGAGNPGGGQSSGGGGAGQGVAGGSGTGGLLILIVGGNLTIGATGKIEANGVNGGTPLTTACGGSHPDALGGGGSGGGNILVLHRGALSNSGVIQAAGGLGGTADFNGGAGGNGSVQIDQVN